MINYRSAGNLRGLSEDAKYLRQGIEKNSRENTGVFSTIVFSMSDLLGIGGISGGAASQEISRGIFSGGHFDGQELMLGRHLLSHARWPLNVRIAAVFNDMGEVRRAVSRGWGCLRIY